MMIKDSGGVWGPEGIEREFCTWECFADWAAVQAGRRLPSVV